VKWRGSQWIIFSFIVRQLVHCGMLFFFFCAVWPLLAYASLRQRVNCMLVVGRAAVRGVQLCGKWSHIVFCGVFRGKETIDASRTWRGLQRNSYITFSFLFTPGPWVGLPRGVLAFQFFLFLSLPLVPLVYSLCTKGCAPLHF
jgi:hypothetical protein